jgi:hypothetical protein
MMAWSLNELFAVVSKAFKKMGKSIPEDVAIIAYRWYA